MKLIAAMSGGVDSAVAAARAVEAGHEVIGVHLALAANPQKYRSGCLHSMQPIPASLQPIFTQSFVFSEE